MSSTISLTKTVRLQYLLAHLFLRLYAIDMCFYFYLVQLLCLGKLARLKYHEYNLKLLIFPNAIKHCESGKLTLFHLSITFANTVRS